MSLYTLDSKALLGDDLSQGPNPCYVAVNQKKNLVFTANYHKAQVNVYNLNADKTLTLVDSFVSDGKGPRLEQEASHLHFSDLTPDNRLAVVDLGSDRVFTFDVSDQGKLTLVSTYNAQAGYGPRHLVFHPNGKFAYLVGELSSQIQTLAYNKEDGSFSLVQTLKTIPDDWTSHNGAAAIHISKDGKFVYVSNRGHNSLAVFKVLDDFSLQRIQLISTYGDFPRDFDLDPSQKFVLAANQNTDNATLYQRNEENGELTLVQKDITLPEGVCVKFY